MFNDAIKMKRTEKKEKLVQMYRVCGGNVMKATIRQRRSTHHWYADSVEK